MRTLDFDESTAVNLIRAIEQAQERVERQRQERSNAVEHALVDFEGAYKELFIQAADVASTDCTVLITALRSLGTQISAAKTQAQKEQQRLDDLAEWEQRQPLWDAFSSGSAASGMNPFVAYGSPVVDRWLNKPSETPISPPTINASFEPRERARTSRGSSEDTSSARPDLLRGFVSTSETCNRILDEELTSLQSTWSAFRTTCSWAAVDSFTLLNGFSDYLVECETDAKWLAHIADAFEIAGGGGELMDSVLNGMAASALIPAMSDQQLLNTLKRLDEDQLSRLFESSPALANQLRLVDPVTINEWWHGLAAGGVSQQTTLLQSLPRVFGNLEGIPYANRNTANQIALNLDLVALSKRIGSLQGRIAWHDQHGNGQHDDLLARLEEFTALQKTMGELKTLSTKGYGDNPTSLVSYEFGYPPLAAISLGDLDTAATVTYNVPGMGNSTKNMRSWMAASNNLHETVSRGDDAATVAWMYYDTPPMPWPPTLDSLDVLSNERAEVGGERLADNLAGFRAVRSVDEPQLNGKAHSFGGPTFIHAITQPGVHVDNVFLVSTPGAQSHITHASQLNADNVYATRIRNTIYGIEDGLFGLPNEDGDNAAWMGRVFSDDRETDVMDPEFGATLYGSDTGTDDVGLPATKHGALADPGEDGAGPYDVYTENLLNVGLAINGQPEKMSPYIDKGPTSLQERVLEFNDNFQDLTYGYEHATSPTPVE